MNDVRPIEGRCPACGEDSLYLGRRNVIFCAVDECPAPALVADLLAKRDQHRHIIEFREDGYSAQHPLAERIRLDVQFACDLREDFAALSEPPGFGLYVVEPGKRVSDAYEVSRESVEFEVESAPPSPEVQRQPPPVIAVGVATAIPADAPLLDGFMEVGDGVVINPTEHPDIAEKFGQHEPFLLTPPNIDIGADRRFVLRYR